MNTLITSHVPPFPSFKPLIKFFPPKHLQNYQITPTYLSGHPEKILGIAHCSPNLGHPKLDDGSGTELGRLLALLPEGMRGRIEEHPEVDKVVEVVMDLGRKPLARFPSGDFKLSDSPISFQDIEYATAQVGDFGIDNRAGISHTLHRISAIRNRKGMIIGLTCRVGRAITGSADLLRDLVEDGASLLLIGPPGVGKTTIIREIARMLADDYKKRVMIVDTSNEIGGDGDIPHAGIGNARRMQVPHLDMQHKVLIEAVENHMPQAIVIDEIGTKLEAMAASTISQRGIQLVATAHGRTIENLIKNPALDMLVGGIQSVTLGDEEASRRRVQKTILERKGPPTFRCAVELMSKTELRVHKSLQVTVDAILAGRCPEFAVRKMDFQGLGETKKESSTSPDSSGKNFQAANESSSSATAEQADRHSLLESPTADDSCMDEDKAPPIRVFVYGILDATVAQGIHKLNLEDAVEMTDNISEADVILALQSKLKKNLGIQAVAKSHDKPVYVTKTSSLVQVTKALRSLMTDHEDTSNVFELDDRFRPPEEVDALEEARIAIEKIVILLGKPVELLPRPPQILSLQAELAQRYQLQSEIVGLDSEAHLRIIPIYSDPSTQLNDEEAGDAATALEEYLHTNGNGDASPHRVERLPILPDSSFS